MGTWRGTCGLSHLPINTGDKVLLFILLKAKYERNLGCGYASDTPYNPVCIPIHGKYNELGSIEDIQLDSGITENILIDHIKELLKRKEINYNDSTDYQPIDLKQLIEDIARGKIKNLSFMLVFEDLHINLMAEFSLRKNYTEESIKERAIKSVKEYTDAKKADTSMFFEYDEFLFSRFFYRNKMKSLIDNIISTENQELVKALIELYIFNELLDISRILWTPQAGTGSNYDEYEVHNKIGQYVAYKKLSQQIVYTEESIADDEIYEGIGKDIPAWI